MKGNKWLNSLLQIALILLASLIVVGATWQIGQSSSAQAAFERGEPPDRPAGDRPEPHDHEDRPEPPDFGERGERGGGHHSADLSLRGIAGFGETVVKMVVVITAVVLGQRAWEGFQTRRT